MVTQALALVLFALAGSDVVNEPASPEDAAARRAWFDATVRQSAIGPCKAAFPADAAAFERSQDAWSKANAELVAEGAKSIRDASGSAEGVDLVEAEQAIAQLLDGMSPERRREWCADYF